MLQLCDQNKLITAKLPIEYFYIYLASFSVSNQQLKIPLFTVPMSIKSNNRYNKWPNKNWIL